MKLKKLIPCLLAVLILTGCQKGETPVAQEPEAAAQEQEAEKPTVPKEELSKYVFPYEDRWILGQSSYEQLLSDIEHQDYKPLPPINDFYSYIECEEHKNTTIWVSEEQKQALIANNLKLAKELAEFYSSTEDIFTVEWADDYSSVTERVRMEDFYPDNIMKIYGRAGQCLLLEQFIRMNRVLSTDDQFAPIYVTYKNANSGYIIASSLMPYEGIVFNEKDYELSKTQDVLITSEYEGLEEIKMAVKKIDGNKIIFTPQESGSFYAEDDSLCICLDTVYADSVAFPDNIKVGDIYVLRVDGNYAIHDDGDDIPDIAPETIVPLKYLEERAK